jgi:hypothetical protein
MMLAVWKTDIAGHLIIVCVCVCFVFLLGGLGEGGGWLQL